MLGDFSYPYCLLQSFCKKTMQYWEVLIFFTCLLSKLITLIDVIKVKNSENMRHFYSQPLNKSSAKWVSQHFRVLHDTFMVLGNFKKNFANAGGFKFHFDKMKQNFIKFSHRLTGLKSYGTLLFLLAVRFNFPSKKRASKMNMQKERKLQNWL